MKKQRKSMFELMAQVESDPRFVKTMNSLHASPDPFSTEKIHEQPKENIDEDSKETSSRIKPVLVKNTLDTRQTGNLVTIQSDSLVTRQGIGTIPSGNVLTRPPDNICTRPSGTNTLLPDDYQTIPRDVFNLAKNQVLVLSFLIDKPIPQTTYNEISKQTNVGRDSVIAAIESIVKKGFLNKKVVKNSKFQGFSFVLNKSLCDHFLNVMDMYRHFTHPDQTSVTSIVQPSSNVVTRQQDSMVTIRSDSLVVMVPDSQAIHSSSSSLNNTSTTKETPDGMVTTQAGNDDFVIVGPEMAYWESSGLQERQAQVWRSEFAITAAELRQQLAWARWDLVSNGKEKEVKKDVIRWVYGYFKRTGGCYPRPDNYQSPLEIRAEQMKIQQEKEEKARQEIERMELENGFKIVWSNPDGEEYQAIWSCLSKMEKEFAKGSTILEQLMKAKYMALHVQNP